MLARFFNLDRDMNVWCFNEPEQREPLYQLQQVSPHIQDQRVLSYNSSLQWDVASYSRPACSLLQLQLTVRCRLIFKTSVFSLTTPAYSEMSPHIQDQRVLSYNSSLQWDVASYSRPACYLLQLQLTVRCRLIFKTSVSSVTTPAYSEMSPHIQDVNTQ